MPTVRGYLRKRGLLAGSLDVDEGDMPDPTLFDDHPTTLVDATQLSLCAFTSLYGTFAGEIAALAGDLKVRCVDELVVDVFLSAFRSMGRFDGDVVAFRRHLHRIAREKIDNRLIVSGREGDPTERIVLRRVDGADLGSLFDTWDAAASLN